MIRSLWGKLSRFISAHPGWFLCLLSFVVTVVYVFCFTEYWTYNDDSDAGGYWFRAIARFEGEHFSVDQWVIWPPLYHIILSWLFYPIKFFGLWEYNLSVIIFLQILLGSVSIYFLYQLLVRIFHNKKLSFDVTLFYVFTYPVVYLYAFVFSENIALPLFIIALSLVFCHTDQKKYLFIAGLLFGISIGVRPAFVLFVLPVNFYIFAYRHKGWAWGNAVAFGIAFTLIFSAVSLENYRISNGAVKGLGANGGLNFFLGQCKVSEVNSRFDNWYYIIGPPGYEEYYGKRVFNTTHPMYDQDYFYDLGKKCLKERDGVIWENIDKIKFLFVGQLFPIVPSAFGVLFFIPIFTVIITVTAILSFFIWPVLWVRKYDRSRQKILWVFWSFMFLTFVMAFFFHTERRYIYSLIFVIYVMFFSVFAISWPPSLEWIRRFLVGSQDGKDETQDDTRASASP